MKTRNQQNSDQQLFIWQKNFLHNLQMHDALILHGNIRDKYIFIDEEGEYYEVKFDELLTRMIAPRYGTIRRYDPYRNVHDLSIALDNTYGTAPVKGFGPSGFGSDPNIAIARFSQTFISALGIGNGENEEDPRVWVIHFMHNFLPYKNSYTKEEYLRLIPFQFMIEQISSGRKLILTFLSDTQVPLELSTQLHNVGLMEISLPGFQEREAFFREKLKVRQNNKKDSEKTEKLMVDLAKVTDGFALSSLITIANMATSARKSINSMRLKDWEKIVHRYKFGDTFNPYEQIEPDVLLSAKLFFTKVEGVKGQDHAVMAVIHMLLKARTNISSLLSGSTSPPRGVLFFCGPSGTGKTFLSKKIAKFVFGSEEAFHRFDMSEFQQDHTVSKLIGSPPGYVGYEKGGLLTNAITRKPFSVILFDEIEKAHPRIFDIFLQILSDGRLTDSRGQVVYFSEAIIIFTSNLGTRAEHKENEKLAEIRNNTDDKEERESKIRKHFKKSVRDYFVTQISRPELYNRIGDHNVIPFNFLESDDVIRQAIHFYLKQFVDNFNERFKERKIRIKVNTQNSKEKSQEKGNVLAQKKIRSVVDYLVVHYGDRVREFGGRAILHIMDEILLSDLAAELIHLENKQDGKLTVLTIDVGQTGSNETPRLVIRS